MKNILITGASKGIGKTIALHLSPQNRIFLVARGKESLENLAQEIHQKGGQAHVFVLDISDENAVNIMAEQILAHFQVDVVINNAGVGAFKPIEEFDAAQWDWMMNINAKGTFLVSKAFVPHFKQKRTGLIINIASDVAKRTFENGSLYCASKYAQEAFTQVLRKELRPFGVRVSCIYPGITSSEFDGQSPQADYKNNWLPPQQIANAVAHIIESPQDVLIDELMIHPIWQAY